MRYLRLGFLAVILIIAVTMALANRSDVTLKLWPDALTSILGTQIAVTLPLFIVIGLAFAIGLLIGLGLEWLRERGMRAEAAKLRRQIEAATRETRASDASGKPKDDILALVEPAQPAR